MNAADQSEDAPEQVDCILPTALSYLQAVQQVFERFEARSIYLDALSKDNRDVYDAISSATGVFGYLYRIDSDQLVSAVLDFWSRVSANITGRDCSNDDSSTHWTFENPGNYGSYLLQRLHKLGWLLVPAIGLMHHFYTCTGTDEELLSKFTVCYIVFAQTFLEAFALCYFCACTCSVLGCCWQQTHRSDRRHEVGTTGNVHFIK